MSLRYMKFIRPNTLQKIERIRALLRETDLLTTPEIAERIHVHIKVADAYLEHMKEQNLVHHPKWTRESVAGLRPYLRPMWRVGPGKNAPRPPRLTSAQAQARLRKRVEQDPDGNDRVARNLEAYRAKRAHRHRMERLKTLEEHGWPPHIAAPLAGALRVGTQCRSPTPEQVSDIIRLRDEGATWKQVASATGVPLTTARHYYLRIAGNTC